MVVFPRELPGNSFLHSPLKGEACLLAEIDHVALGHGTPLGWRAG